MSFIREHIVCATDTKEIKENLMINGLYLFLQKFIWIIASLPFELIKMIKSLSYLIHFALYHAQSKTESQWFRMVISEVTSVNNWHKVSHPSEQRQTQTSDCSGLLNLSHFFLVIFFLNFRLPNEHFVEKKKKEWKNEINEAVDEQHKERDRSSNNGIEGFFPSACRLCA
jgi:hypothetical protein